MILRFTSRAHRATTSDPRSGTLADAIIAEMAEALVEIGDACRAPYGVLYSLIAQEMTHDSIAERATRLSARPWGRGSCQDRIQREPSMMGFTDGTAAFGARQAPERAAGTIR
jgi:hypothetical protein